MYRLYILLTLVISALGLKSCAGAKRKCNFNTRFRVCAKIGIKETSFWKFIGQDSICGTKGEYKSLRCPPDKPTWCICKWKTAKWIKGKGCGDDIQFDCEATDICDLKASYELGEELQPAKKCMKKKCKKQWDKCPD